MSDHFARGTVAGMGRHAIKTPPHHATWQEFLDTWVEADRIEVYESAWKIAPARVESLATALS